MQCRCCCVHVGASRILRVLWKKLCLYKKVWQQIWEVPRSLNHWRAYLKTNRPILMLDRYMHFLIYICTVSISNNYGKFSETEINYNKGPFVVCICFNFFKRQAMIKIDSFFFTNLSIPICRTTRKKNDLFRNLFFTNTIFI